MSLRSEDGRPALFTHLERPAWQRVFGYFGDKLDGELYLAILHIKMLARKWEDGVWVKTWAERSSRLINTVYFDPSAYDGTPLQRLAAALAWAIATFRGEDPGEPKAELRAVAFCLAKPMSGGVLYTA